MYKNTPLFLFENDTKSARRVSYGQGKRNAMLSIYKLKIAACRAKAKCLRGGAARLHNHCPAGRRSSHTF
nr:MAG TPA: hypothetical protein [Caudoviricetes sp.]